jgi:hypothetical protein
MNSKNVILNKNQRVVAVFLTEHAFMKLTLILYSTSSHGVILYHIHKPNQ